MRALTNESGHITGLLFGAERDLRGEDIDAIMQKDGVATALCAPCPSVLD